jgi:hypothetical protein
LKRHWNWIWEKINYVPIFQIGEAILAEIPINPNAMTGIRWLMKEAKSICANQTALRHDLMGRIYHWLLHEAKYLGTYYTATSSATLLLKLTFSHPWPNQDFASYRKLGAFVVADLACGTGTLLMAAAQAIADQFVLSRVQAGKSLRGADLIRMHQVLMEKVLWGYDVLPSAVHLTASTLGMLAPSVTFRSMSLCVMPLGVEGRTRRLGSLDFIDHQRVHTQLTLDNTHLQARQSGVATERDIEADVPQMDLCVMNPPFVRSVGGNLLFGSLPDDDRAKLQEELKRKARNLQASVTAGLGSVFLAVADKYLKTGGRLAFVLPVALATGEAWGESRKLLSQKYDIETVIVSHEAERPNFSENTDLSEIMIIARKLKSGERPGRMTVVNLWANPKTIYEGMALADLISHTKPALVEGSVIAAVQNAEGRKLAEVVSMPPSEDDSQWLGVQFAQTWSLRAAMYLERGMISIPGSMPVRIPLCPLGSLGDLGPDRKRIHEGFTVSPTEWSPYPAFWNHEADKVLCMKQSPNSYLSPWEESPRGADYGLRQLWPRAGQILLVERLWPITHRVMAIRFDQHMLGNTWWALRTEIGPDQEKALTVWLNSTPALLLFLSRRVATRSAWMQVKQPAWTAMPVLDTRALSTEAVSALAQTYDTLCTRELQALAKLDGDSVREEIDEAISKTLEISDIKPLRQLLAREPGLTGLGLSSLPHQLSMLSDEEEDSTASSQLRFIS